MSKDKVFYATGENLRKKQRLAQTAETRAKLGRDIATNKKIWRQWFENTVVLGKTRVILDLKDRIKPSKRNPVWQSIYSCYGVIINRIDIQSHLEPIFEVLWDNGEVNRYRFTRLRIMEGNSIPPAPTGANAMHPNPNKGFLMKKNREFLASRKPLRRKHPWAKKKKPFDDF